MPRAGPVQFREGGFRQRDPVWKVVVLRHYAQVLEEVATGPETGSGLAPPATQAVRHAVGGLQQAARKAVTPSASSPA